MAALRRHRRWFEGAYVVALVATIAQIIVRGGFG